MEKVEVTQQQRQQIIYLYQEKYYGIEKIRKELKLNIGYNSIKKILSEENIHIRTFKEAKVGKREQYVSRDIELKIIEAYEKGWGLDKIVSNLNLPFGFEKVRNILIKNNIHIRTCKEAYEVCEKVDLRKYTLNDNYNLISHNGAWLIGFIAADGYLPITNGSRNRIVITVAKKDKTILEAIAKELEYDGKIYEYQVKLNNKLYDEVSLSFASKKIRNQLEKYGIVNNKTFKLCKIPDIPDEYKIDFIAGFFDGDGSVYYKDKSLDCSFSCASSEMLEQINQYLIQYCGLSEDSGHISTDKNIYELKYLRKNDVLLILDKFYNNNYLRLDRKKNKYLIERNKSHETQYPFL